MAAKRELERETRRKVDALWREVAMVVSPVEHDLDFTGPTEVLIAIGHIRRALDALEAATVVWARHPRRRGGTVGLVSWADIGRYLRGWSSREAARKRWGHLIG